MTAPHRPAETLWTGRRDLRWNIIVQVELDAVPSTRQLRSRLTALSSAHGWEAPPADAVIEGEGAMLLGRLADVPGTGHPVSVGRTSTGLVVRAHHAFVDGLGLLALVRDLAAVEIRSTAVGAADRPSVPVARTMLGRLAEIALHPPAGVATSRPAGHAADTPPAGDVFGSVSVPGSHRTAELAYAAVRAVTAWNLAAGVRADRVALAVGISTAGGADLVVADRSGFLRLTDAERCSRTEISRAIGQAPLQVGGTARTGTVRRASGIIRWGTRVFASRLGSTLLVSHLGRVDAASVLSGAFYPMAGGGSGLSLGAVVVRDTTTVTLRARAHQHTAEELDRLLHDIAERLD